MSAIVELDRRVYAGDLGNDESGIIAVAINWYYRREYAYEDEKTPQWIMETFNTRNSFQAYAESMAREAKWNCIHRKHGRYGSTPMSPGLYHKKMHKAWIKRKTLEQMVDEFDIKIIIRDGISLSTVGMAKWVKTHWGRRAAERFEILNHNADGAIGPNDPIIATHDNIYNVLQLHRELSQGYRQYFICHITPHIPDASNTGHHKV